MQLIPGPLAFPPPSKKGGPGYEAITHIIVLCVFTYCYYKQNFCGVAVGIKFISYMIINRSLWMH